MEYLVVFLIVGIFGVVVWLIAKKSTAQTQDFVSKLTDEQKNRIMNADAFPVEGKKFAFVQENMIVEVTDKGKKYAVKSLYVNRVNNNGTIGEIQSSEFSVKKEEFDKKGLAVGSFVDVVLDYDKCNAYIA